MHVSRGRESGRADDAAVSRAEPVLLLPPRDQFSAAHDQRSRRRSYLMELCHHQDQQTMRRGRRPPAAARQGAASWPPTGKLPDPRERCRKSRRTCRHGDVERLRASYRPPILLDFVRSVMKIILIRHSALRRAASRQLFRRDAAGHRAAEPGAGGLFHRRLSRADLGLEAGRCCASYTFDVAAGFLACGLDPARTILFRQSDVPQVHELAWLLSVVTPHGPARARAQLQGQGRAGRGDEPRPLRLSGADGRRHPALPRRCSCRWARTRSSISRSRATSRRNSTTASAPSSRFPSR